MRLPPRPLGIAAGVAVLAAPACVRAVPPQRPALPPALADSLIPEEMRRLGIPGLAVAVVQDGHVAVVRGFGVADAATGTPVTDSTLFQLGSVTKLLTATLVATLAEEGRVSLREPVGARLPGLPDWVSRLTLHQLLSHTAGVRDVPADSGLHDERALRDFVAGWTAEYALLPAGRVFSYSNPGYALAGAAIESATATPFADLFREILLAPLGMRDAAFRPAEVERHAHATGYVGTREVAPRPLAHAADDTRFWPAGYLHASARDLARFVVALVDGGRVGGRRVLPGRAIARVLTPAVAMPVDPPRAAYGYGLILQRRRDVRVAWHDGAMPGFSALIMVVPAQRTGVAVLANREGVDLEAIAEAALGMADGGADADAQSQEGAGVVPRDEALGLVGRYVNRWTFELALRGDSLVLERFGQRLTVRRAGANRFLAAAPGGRIEEFRVLRDASRAPVCLLMYLWAFCRESRGRPSGRTL